MSAVSVPSKQWDAIVSLVTELNRATDEWHQYNPPPRYEELAVELARALRLLFRDTSCEDCLDRKASCPEPCRSRMAVVKAALARADAEGLRK